MTEKGYFRGFFILFLFYFNFFILFVCLLAVNQIIVPRFGYGTTAVLSVQRDAALKVDHPEQGHKRSKSLYICKLVLGKIKVIRIYNDKATSNTS